MALGEIKNGTGLDEYGIYQKVLADLAGKCVVASGFNYVRFGDGTQICWGMVKSPKLTALQYGVGSKFTFPVAFADNAYAVASSFTFDAGYGGNLKIHSSTLTNTYADILFLNTGNNVVPAGSNFRLIFIGRWK